MDATPVFARNDAIFLADGTLLQTHPAWSCAGQFCCVHNPSDHPLRDAPLFWLQDTRSMDRLCSHGVRHPDYDDFAFKVRSGFPRYMLAIVGAHSCDGCCHWPLTDPDDGTDNGT